MGVERPRWVDASGGVLAICVVCFAVSSAACRPARTASERCRKVNALSRMTTPQRDRDRVAETLEDMRCDAMEHEERREARHREVLDREREAQTEDANRKLEAVIAEIRRAPRVPELGSTRIEVRVLCEQQRAALYEQGSVMTCAIRRVPLYTCTLDAGNIVDRCDGYFEAADLAAQRGSMTAQLGQPNREGVSADGFRFFGWSAGERSVVITMYPRGVRVTTMREREPDSDSAASGTSSR